MIELIYADLRVNKLGKLCPNFTTPSPFSRGDSTDCATASWEVFSQLPRHYCDGVCCKAQEPVGKVCMDFHVLNLNSCNNINLFSPFPNCGGVTTPYGGGVRLRLRLAHSPLARVAKGFARAPP